MSDTPRTDAEILRIQPGVTIENSPLEIIRPDFARTLERELAEAREWADVAQVARQELIKENDQVKRELAEEQEELSITDALYSKEVIAHGETEGRAEQAERELAETKAALSKLCDIVNTLKRVHESDNQINQQLRESTEQALEKEKHQRAEDEAQYALDLQRERDEAKAQLFSMTSEAQGLSVLVDVMASERDKFRDLNDYAEKRILQLRGERDEAYARAAQVADDYDTGGFGQHNNMIIAQTAAIEIAIRIRALSKPQDTEDKA